MRRQAAPSDGAGERELVEELRVVVAHAAREYLALPCVGRDLEALHLAERFQRAALAQELRAVRDVLPAEKPAHEDGGGGGLDRLAQFADGQAMDAREQAAFRPLGFARGDNQ